MGKKDIYITMQWKMRANVLRVQSLIQVRGGNGSRLDAGARKSSPFTVIIARGRDA